MASVAKLNESECRSLGEMLGVGDPIAWLQRQKHLHCVALTLGAKGCRLICGDEQVTAPAEHVGSTEDSVGAGDAFTAFLASRFTQTLPPLDSLAREANAFAGRTLAQPGALPDL